MKAIEQAAIDIVEEEKESPTASVKDIAKAIVDEHEVELKDRWKLKFNSSWRSSKKKRDKRASTQRKLNARKNKRRK